jgi:hypothetical protein
LPSGTLSIVKSKRLVQPGSKPRRKIVPLRLPADLVEAVDVFANEAQPALAASGAMRLLMRAGLAAHQRVPFDLRGAMAAEGFAAGQARAAELYQTALSDARAKLGTRGT